MSLKKVVTGVVIAGALMMPASTLAYGGGGYSHHNDNRSSHAKGGLLGLVLGDTQVCNILVVLSNSQCYQK